MSAPRPCANCGKPAVEHWVRPGIGSMYCEPGTSADKYDRGTLTPDEGDCGPVAYDGEIFDSTTPLAPRPSAFA